jgi:hypothetical protein
MRRLRKVIYRAALWLVLLLELVGFWIERRPVSHLAAFFSPRLWSRGRAIVYQGPCSITDAVDFRGVLPPYPHWPSAPYFGSPQEQLAYSRLHEAQARYDAEGQAVREELSTELYGMPTALEGDRSWWDPGNARCLGPFLIITGDRGTLLRAERVMEGIRLRQQLRGFLQSYGWVLALCSVAVFIMKIERKRLGPKRGCVACGYDLRATPNRCPECGLKPILTSGTSRGEWLANWTFTGQPLRPRGVSLRSTSRGRDG